MIKDKLNQFSDKQVLTAVGETNSSKSLDYKAHADIGVDISLFLYVLVDESVQAPGTASVRFDLQTDDKADFSTAVSVIRSESFEKAKLVPGFQWGAPLPMGLKRYMRLQYFVTSENDDPLTQGRFTAGFTLAMDAHYTYPSGLQTV